jgi:Spy/CpxP family protein refolding chaperone
MKKIVLMLVVLASITLGAHAQQDSTRRGGGGQGRRTPEERAKMQTEQMTKRLSLTPEQVVKIEEINLKFAKEPMAGGAGADWEARMAAMKKMQDDKNAAFKPILTPAQYDDYLKMVEENRARMAERMKNGPGGGN